MGDKRYIMEYNSISHEISHITVIKTEGVSHPFSASLEPGLKDERNSDILYPESSRRSSIDSGYISSRSSSQPSSQPSSRSSSPTSGASPNHITLQIDSNGKYNLLAAFLNIPQLLEFRKLFTSVIARQTTNPPREGIIHHEGLHLLPPKINPNQHENENPGIHRLPMSQNKHQHWETLVSKHNYVIYIDDNIEPTINPNTIVITPTHTLIKLVPNEFGGITNYLGDKKNLFTVTNSWGDFRLPPEPHPVHLVGQQDKHSLTYIIHNLLQHLRTAPAKKIIFKFDFDCTLSDTHLYYSVMGGQPKFTDEVKKHIPTFISFGSETENDGITSIGTNQQLWFNYVMNSYPANRFSLLLEFLKWIKDGAHNQPHTHMVQHKQLVLLQLKFFIHHHNHVHHLNK